MKMDLDISFGYRNWLTGYISIPKSLDIEIFMNKKAVKSEEIIREIMGNIKTNFRNSKNDGE